MGKKKFDERWAKTELEYREAGMPDDFENEALSEVLRALSKEQ